MNMTLLPLIARLAHHRVVVVGDVILDEYVIGSAERMSREAPIPVLELRERRYIAGGAANPAVNMLALGSQAVQVGIVGQDAAAVQLETALTKHGILTALVPCTDRPTTLKTRILAQMGLRFPQQVARVDTLSRETIPAAIENFVLARILPELPHAHALLFSDYHGGLLTPTLIAAIQQAAHHTNLLITADAQGSLEKYRQVHLVKCNADDAQQYIGRRLRTAAEFGAAARELCQALDLRGAMVITRGAEGATLAEPDGTITHCPAPHVRQVYDTVGAGDTAIAVMTLARLGGATYPAAVQLANYASGIVIQHVGNYAPTPSELAAALTAPDELHDSPTP
jgi:rfaE bifunctional protein kinase chain/domain